MIEKVVRKAKLSEFSEIEENHKYWLSETPEERVAAVEFLRQQTHGELPRMQRVVRVVKRSENPE